MLRTRSFLFVYLGLLGVFVYPELVERAFHFFSIPVASAYISNGANAIDLLGESDMTSFTDPVPIYNKSGVNDGPNTFGFNGGSTFGSYGNAIDTTNHRLFIVDNTNNRVLVYNLTAGNLLVDHLPDNVIGQANFYTGTAATTQPGLNSPQGIAYDGTNNRLYVAQSTSNRITIYNTSSITNGMNAVNVLGQGTSFSTSTAAVTQPGLSSPRDLAVDPANNNLYVADAGNNRILRYDTTTITNGMNAADLLGQSDQTSFTDPVPIYNKSGVNDGPNTFGFNGLQGIAFDSTNHRLFVVDAINHRVLVYNLTNPGNLLVDHLADNVIGQANFYTNTSAQTQPGLGTPSGVAYDATNNRLYVVATGRVMVYDTSSITNGMNALNVLGQVGFGTNTAAVTQPGLTPNSVAADPAHSLLYVGDANRVIVYNTSTITNGMNALNVLGQTTFNGSTAATTQPGMNGVAGAAIDSGNNRLYVSQSIGGGRVTVYDVSAITNGMNAVNVIGQADFSSSTQASTQPGFNIASGVALDTTHNRLYVSQVSNAQRISVFNIATITNGMNAVNVLGQTTFSATQAATTQLGLSSPRGMAYDSTNDRMYVSDNGNNRVVVYDVSAITNGMNAKDLLGQSDQTSFTDPVPIYNKSGANDGGNKFGSNVSGGAGIDLDTTNHRLFVVDGGNNRVLVYNLSNTNTLSNHLVDNVLGQTTFYGNTSTAASQTSMGGGGVSSGIAYDSTNNRLYVAESSASNKIKVYDVAAITDGENAVNVLGQTFFSGTTAAATQPGLSNPTGLAVDPASNRLYAWDMSNNRVVIYNTSTITNGMNAADLLGQSDMTSFTDPVPAYAKSGANDGPNTFGFSAPNGIAFDGTNHRLFVVDVTNNRVLVYNLTAGNLLTDHLPDNVIGQANFYTGTSATTQPGLNTPNGIGYDATNNRLYVVASGRVMVYNTTTITNGMNALNVLGQTTFSGNGGANSQPGITAPNSVAIDSGNNRLYVGQGSGGNRVTVYDTTTITNGMNAVNVLGQTAFNTGTGANTQPGLNIPNGVAIDSGNNRLYVSQSTGNRVEVYDVSAITNGMNAVNVLGQTVFDGSSAATTQPGLNGPVGVALDSAHNRLYVSQPTPNRITVYNTTTITNGMNALNVLGQSTFNGNAAAATQPGVNIPVGMAYDTTNDRLYVADNINNRITVYDADPGKTISGTVYTDEGTTTMGSGRTVAISINGAAAATTTTTAADGTYSLPYLGLVANDVVTVYLDGAAEQAVTVSKVAAATLTGFNLYQNDLITRCDNSCSLTNANLDTADNNADADITSIYSVSGSTLTVAAGKSIFIPSSHTFAPAGNVSVGGNFTNNGTYTKGTETLTLTGTGTQTLKTNASQLYDLTINGIGGTYTLQDALSVADNLTITAGTLDANNSSNFGVTVGATWSRSGTFTPRSGTLTLTGTSTFSDTTSFYNLTINGSGKTVTLGAALTTTNNLTITAGTLDGGSNAITIGGNWSNAGAYTGTGTVTFNASSGTQTLTSGGTGVTQDFQTVTKSGGGTLQFATNAVDIDGTLTIDASTVVDLNGQNITANTLVNNGTLLADGNETITITTKDTDSGLVKYDGSGSYTTSLPYGNTYYDLEFAGSGVWEPNGAVTTNRNLTVTSGTFDIDGNNLTVTGTFSNIGTLRLLGTETVSLTPDTDSGTISYDNSSALPDFPNPFNDTYNNLTLEGSGTVTLANDLTVTGNFTISSGATLAYNGYNQTVAGNFVNSGTASGTSSRTFTLNGTTQTFNPSNITIGTLSLTGSSGTVSLGSNFTLGDLLSIAAGRVLSLLSYTLTASSTPITNLGTISEGTGAIIRSSSNLYIADSNFDEDAAISLGVDSVYISITDEDGNLNGASADSLSGVVVSCPTDSETVALTETGAASEVFRNAGLTTALYAGSNTNNNGILTCANGTTITATYTDPQDGSDTRSDTASATSETVPTAPSSFAGTASSTTSITWTWTDNASNETGFKLYNSSNTLIATIATANTTSYTETGLTASTSYTRKLVAYNDAGNSSYSGSATVTTDSAATVPTAPSSFAGTAASNTSITWTWTDNASNETGFKLLDSDSNTIATIATANTTSYTETGLTKNTSYTRKLVAYNADGNSAATSTVTVSTSNLSPAAFSLISPANGALVSTGLPTFSFKKSSESGGSISSYTLYVGSLSFTGIPASGSASSNPVSATDYENTYTAQYFSESDSDANNDYIVVTLKDGSTSLPLADGKYVWYVKAIDAEGASTISEDRTITIDATSPSITGLTNTSTNPLRPELIFTAKDSQGLKELTITLEQARTAFATVLSYTPIETRTYVLSGKSQAISFIPRKDLTPGKYRYTIVVTDTSGHTTTKTITLTILSREQQANADIAALNPESDSTPTIIQTLRNLLPNGPINIPALEEKAVIRRQLQAENFSTFLSKLNFRQWPGEAALERAIARLFGAAGHAIASFINTIYANLTGIGTAIARAFTSAMHSIAYWFGYGVDRAVALYNNTVHGALRISSVVVNGTVGRITHINITAPLNRVASSLTVSRVGLETWWQHIVQQVRNGGHAIASFVHIGNDTRIRQGLAHRQIITRGLEKFTLPIRHVGNEVALRTRAIYEIIFEHTATKISNLAMNTITPTSVTINWETNHLTHLGKVNYGTSTQYNQEVFEEDGLRDHHTVTLHNLTPNTTYYFEVMNQNGGYVYDAYYTVTTLQEGASASGTFVPQIAVIQGTTPVPVHKEPAPNSPIVTTLLPGTRVRALTEQGSWISVLLSSGQEAWVLKENVRLSPQEGVSASAQH